jgi:hypothetical protein
MLNGYSTVQSIVRQNGRGRLAVVLLFLAQTPKNRLIVGFFAFSVFLVLFLEQRLGVEVMSGKKRSNYEHCPYFEIEDKLFGKCNENKSNAVAIF